MSAANSLPWNDASIRVTIPIRTVNEGNTRCHWATRAKRTKQARQAAAFVVQVHARKCKPVAPYVITLTRIAPRRLDSDGVASALKAVRDGVADALGINDGDTAHEWKYAQRHYDKDRREPGLQVGGYGVEILVESRAT